MRRPRNTYPCYCSQIPHAIYYVTIAYNYTTPFGTFQLFSNVFVRLLGHGNTWTYFVMLIGSQLLNREAVRIKTYLRARGELYVLDVAGNFKLRLEEGVHREELEYRL